MDAKAPVGPGKGSVREVNTWKYKKGTHKVIKDTRSSSKEKQYYISSVRNFKSYI